MEGVLASVNVDKTGAVGGSRAELSRRSSRSSLAGLVLSHSNRSRQPSSTALASAPSRLATLMSQIDHENERQSAYDQEGSMLRLGGSANNWRATINVSGRKFEAKLDTLSGYPGTLLGNALTRQPYYDPQRDEYFFERNRECFECILAFYQSGLLRRPSHMPIDTFVQEVKFFHLPNEAFLQFCRDEGYEQQEPEPEPKHPLQRRIWQLVEVPHSSSAAKLFAIFSMLVIILSIITFCLETIPDLETALHPATLVETGVGVADNNTVNGAPYTRRGTQVFNDPLFILETVCIAWFTLEFFVRLAVSPDKKRFFKSFLNIIDLVAIIPYYVDLGVIIWGGEKHSASSLVVLRALRLLRVFRIFKISRHSRGLQILGKTFATSFYEMGLLLLFLGIGVILFSSAIYYAELSQPATHFASIPEGFWWALVTMTTVGYGTVVPLGILGKLIGCTCAVSGLLFIALPVPVIVSNFNTIYTRDKERPFLDELFREALDANRSLSIDQTPQRPTTVAYDDHVDAYNPNNRYTTGFYPDHPERQTML
ncbi:hypothetical protein RvY_17956 [Ramazzottius varieornatus]|uniref:BTB domain-containing protein n=1 Tax=Ramazzottius varieornatus TaxID=947166 RepID=A0A1D1W423_RAMVA|nr:hypothetical protein RvY_17956 [Ramazzottius varieornatus]